MKKTRIAFRLLGIALALSGCGAENAEAAPFNIWPWLFGVLGLGVLALAGYQTYCYWQYLQKARSRRRKNTHGVDPLTIGLYIAAAVLLLLAIVTGSFGATTIEPTEPTGEPTNGPTDAPTDPEPTGVVGWVDEGGSRYYMLENGTFATGWMEMEGKAYYFQDNGMTLSGWHEVDGIRRYFRADGSMARGHEVVDGNHCFFTANGSQVELVSPDYPMAEGYVPTLVELSVAYASDGVQIDARIEEALLTMMGDCNDYLSAQYGEDAPRCCVTFGYWSTEELDEDESATSEHHLGLAVDIVDTDTWASDASEPTQKWLEAHSWEYGFILRYPEGKEAATGMEPQSGHYRYVGLELAKELKTSGLTLEEYLRNLH